MTQCQDHPAEIGGASQGGSCHQRLGQRLRIPPQMIAIAYYPAAVFLLIFFTAVLAILARIFSPPTFLSPLDLRLVPIKINWRGPQTVAILSRFRGATNGVATSSVAINSACSATPQGGLDPFVTATTATATLTDSHSENATYPSPATSSLFVIGPLQATKSLTLYPPADVPTSTINSNSTSPSTSTPLTCALAAFFD